jgi:hypothetical protein
MGKNNKRLTTIEFINRARKIHGDKYDYSQSVYLNTYTKLKIKCQIHGYFEQSPEHHLRGHKCPKCSGKNKTTTDIINQFKKIGKEYSNDEIDNWLDEFELRDDLNKYNL